LQDCDSEKHFIGVAKEEGMANFFPDSRLQCLNASGIALGGSGFVKN